MVGVVEANHELLEEIQEVKPLHFHPSLENIKGYPAVGVVGNLLWRLEVCRRSYPDPFLIGFKEVKRCVHPAVGVVEPDDELLEDPSRLLLRQPPVGPVAQRVVEQVAPLRILHRYRQVRGGQEHLRAHAATASAHVLTHAGLTCAPGAGENAATGSADAAPVLAYIATCSVTCWPCSPLPPAELTLLLDSAILLLALDVRGSATPSSNPLQQLLNALDATNLRNTNLDNLL